MKSVRVLVLIASGAAICAAGMACRKSKDEEPKAEPPSTAAFNPLDPLGDAPPEWDPFLSWADEQLTIKPQAVPLPTKPRLPASRVETVRLDDRLDAAKVDCTWQPPDVGDETLVSLGPFRSDQQTPQWQVELQHPNPYESRLRLTAQGFSVQSEDVGRIAIDLRVPWGAHVDLIWSNAGKIRLPLPSNDRSWTLSVTTYGLADWQGPLGQLVLQPDGIGDGVIEVSSIKLMTKDNAFPEPTGLARPAFSKETRNAVYIHTPGSIRFDDVTIPPNGKLQTGIGVAATDAEASNTSCRFRVRVETDGSTTEILSETIERANEWHDLSVSLAKFAGQRVSITLSADAADNAVALWSNPIVYEPVKDPQLVVFYLIDTLAAKNMNTYGYDRETMPHFARLAKQGVLFSRTFANSPKTVTSVPNILFSMSTARHGVYHASLRAADEFVSLAEVFRAAGFATTNFCTNVNAGPRQNADQGFDHFFDHIAYLWTKNADRTVPIEQVMSWIDVHSDRPMFIYIHTAEPHGPYTPPKGYAGRFDTGYRGPINGGYDNSNHGFRTARTAEEIAHVVSLYDEECAYADARLHEFLEALRAAGVFERVHLVVTSDHGEEFLEHGAWTHGDNIYNEVQRVPLLFVGPSVTARGEIDLPVQLHDLMPTLLEMFELPRPYVLNGDSLAALLTGTAQPRRAALSKRTLFAANHAYQAANVIEATVIEHGRWKLMYRFAKELMQSDARPVRFELYDMEADYHERKDVIANHRDRAREMIGKLIAFRRTQSPYESTLDTDRLELTPDQLRELQSLGYVGQFEKDDTE